MGSGTCSSTWEPNMSAQLPALKISSSLPVIRQSEASECGLACLVMIANYHGYKVDIATLRRRFRLSLQGLSLKSLLRIAEQIKLVSRPLSVPLEDIEKVAFPAIVHWDLNHFVVLRAVAKSKFVIHDPAYGERSLSIEQFSRHYTGVVLELAPAIDFEKVEQQQVLRLSDLWSRIFGLYRSLLQVLILTILLQLMVLLSPLYLQIVVDEVISKFDFDLLITLGVGFGGLCILKICTQVLRSYVVLYFSSMLSFQMTVNLFRHLLRLPIEFFDKRHIGDVLSRFESMEPVRSMIAEGFVSGLLDGLMAVSTLIMMFVYSPELASVSLLFLIFYLLLRIMFYKPYRNSQESVIRSEAAEKSIFIEIIRGMTHLKLSASENERENVWKNKYTEVINKNAAFRKLEIWFENSSQLIFGLEYVILIYLASRNAMSGQFTIGMIFAFLAFKQNFSDKASALIERLIEYRLLALHLERISDIALTDQEQSGDPRQLKPLPETVAARIILAKVDYHYGLDTPKIICGLQLTVQAGESIAIVGPSGCGKTTLLKLMTSLYRPTSGDIIINDIHLNNYGLVRYRRNIGVVMQDDNLFSGTLAENIAGFDSELNFEAVIVAAKTAVIHDEIENMPMRYETHIGDMAAPVSGGQKQRILLARALYNLPQILFIDEGTAHLDPLTERQLNESLASLGITRIFVAHRSETIRYADRVLRLEAGKLQEVGFEAAENKG